MFFWQDFLIVTEHTNLDQLCCQPKARKGLFLIGKKKCMQCILSPAESFGIARVTPSTTHLRGNIPNYYK